MTDEEFSKQIKGKFWDFLLEIGIPPECAETYMGSLTGFKVTIEDSLYGAQHPPTIRINCDGRWHPAFEKGHDSEPAIIPAVIMENVYPKIVKFLKCAERDHFNNFKDWQSFGQIVCGFKGSRDKILGALDDAFAEYSQAHEHLLNQAKSLYYAYYISHLFAANRDPGFTQRIIDALGNEGQTLLKDTTEFHSKHSLRIPRDPSDTETVTLAERICGLYEKGASSAKLDEALKLDKLRLLGFDPDLSNRLN